MSKEYPSLAHYLARELFALGDDGNKGECRRIQFKLGHWPNNERDGGGMSESSVVQFLARRLAARPDLIAELAKSQS